MAIKKPKSLVKKRKPAFKYKDGEVILDLELFNRLYRFCPQSGSIQTYVAQLDSIALAIGNSVHAPFVKFLQKQKATVISGYKKRLAEGVTSFDDLLLLLPHNQEVIIQDSDFGAFGAVVKLTQIKYQYGIFVRVTYECLSSGPGKVTKVQRILDLHNFPGVRKISTLPCRPITAGEKVTLIEYGKKFREITSKPSHLLSTGNLLIPSWFGYRRYKNHGRIMVDSMALKQIQPNYDSDFTKPDDDDETGPLGQIPDEHLWMTESRVFGFSFTIKKWGEMAVSDLISLDYRRDAYEKLVLDENTKQAVLALVSHSGKGFSDLIEGKGGGCIFLLHGNPGLGKTLTAEAIADYLERPLYSISAGELGVNPGELETNLHSILDIAANWNAVILLDEADVYLEQRDEKDIVRNAMVGVFLRMLEYHNGVMFLTTNRVRTFDRAFFSRISMVLHYPDMTPVSRAKVWTNLLEACGLHIIVDRLATLELNGRQIKNIIRAAQALANRKEVTEEELFDAVRITTEGAKNIAPKLESSRNENLKEGSNGHHASSL